MLTTSNSPCMSSHHPPGCSWQQGLCVQSSSWTGTPYLRQSDDSIPAAVEVVMVVPSLLDCNKYVTIVTVYSACTHELTLAWAFEDILWGLHFLPVLTQSLPTKTCTFYLIYNIATTLYYWCSDRMVFKLTGSPTVTTPCSLTMLGWWNWPLMAASCRNLTIFSSEVSTFSVFTATSTGPSKESHTPLFT